MTLNNNKNTNIKSENADISNKAQNMTGTQN
jgi:hypothetical protein